jgi:hypothetical protein
VNRVHVLAAAVLVLLSALAWRASSLHAVASSQTLAAGFLFDPPEDHARPEIRSAWDGYLVDQGIPHEWISSGDMTLMLAGSWQRRFPAVFAIDTVNRYVPPPLADMLARYVRDGGVLVVVGDAGTRDQDQHYLERGAFDDVLGIQTIRYDRVGTRAFVNGQVHFTSDAAVAQWDVPWPKLVGDRVLATYKYGALIYQLSNAKVDAPGVVVDAWSGSIPVLAHRKVGKGEAFYVNLPLGYLRNRSDTLPMHAAVRRVLFSAAPVPHFVAAPNGRGMMIFNWHIDANPEWPAIPNLQRQDILRPGVRYDFDVTAGPDRDEPGDGLGFDACGAGAPYLHIIERYGSIGSHGGWAHNWFADGIESHTLSDAQIAYYVRKNDDCVERVTGRPVLDYAAPQGVHPQPEMTRILESLGIIGYYYSGDTGAPAERAFYEGAMPSDTTWAFPIMPFRDDASMGEMTHDRIPPSDVYRWLSSTEQYAAANRGIYLAYSHSYDLNVNRAYDPPFRAYLDLLERDQRAGRVASGDMTQAAQFMQRFVKTSYRFSRGTRTLEVEMSNDQGLAGMTLAVPRAWIAAAPPPVPLRQIDHDPTFAYYAVEGNPHSVDVALPVAR